MFQARTSSGLGCLHREPGPKPGSARGMIRDKGELPHACTGYDQRAWSHNQGTASHVPDLEILLLPEPVLEIWATHKTMPEKNVWKIIYLSPLCSLQVNVFTNIALFFFVK